MKDETTPRDAHKGRHHHAEHHGGRHGFNAENVGQGDRRHHGGSPSDIKHHGGRGGRHGGGGGHEGGPGGGRRGRAGRGEARYVLLDALRDGPKHGYEIIKYLEERSGGEYAPSPGTVYPTMQYLEDLGQARSEQIAERRVYHLTDAGQAEMEARADDLSAFWGRFGTEGTLAASRPEVGFLQEELDNLSRTISNGLRGLANQEDTAKIRLVREAVERCRGEVRQIIAMPNDGKETH